MKLTRQKLEKDIAKGWGGVGQNVGPGYLAGRWGYALAAAIEARSRTAFKVKKQLLALMDSLGVDHLTVVQGAVQTALSIVWWDEATKPEGSYRGFWDHVKKAPVYFRGKTPVAVRLSSGLYSMEKTDDGWRRGDSLPGAIE